MSLYFKRLTNKGYALEKKDVKKWENLIEKVSLTDEQIKEVDMLWEKNYGKKIPLDWHRLYTSYTGKFDKNFFPELFFKPNLVNKLNPIFRKRVLEDKTLLKYYFGGLEKECRIPQNYVYNCNSYYYDENGIITYQKAVEILSNIGEVIIKPAIDSDSGTNVRLLNIKNGVDVNSNQPIEDILKKYKKNYLIQEKVIPHKALAKLYPNSINTIRINTYVCDAVGITSDGKLMKYAFSQKGDKFEKHPNTNIKFEGYEIPKLKEMIEFTKKYHYRIHHIGIIGWDLTVDENNNIVIIEANASCPSLWFPQYCTGEGFFGENTEKMIKMLNQKND